MDISGIIYYVLGGCIILLVLIFTINFIVNFFIRQSSEQALQYLRHRLNQEVEKALLAFKEGVCEQMAMQERKSDSLAKLYASLIDLLRDGKEFCTSTTKPDSTQSEKRLLIYIEAAKSFTEQYKRESLQFNDDFKRVLDGFIVEQESISRYFETQWNTPGKNEDKSENSALIRQTWAKFEDRVLVIMDLMRNEFRKRVQPPESIVKKWLKEGPAPQTPAAQE